MADLPPTRDGSFNPTSPHSSSGGAESFKGTPDTRVTAFSPEDGSGRPNKVLGSVATMAQDSGPIQFGLATSHPRELQSFYRGNLHLERDPFVSSSVTGTKISQKLSPTASVFSPFRPPQHSRETSSEPAETPRAQPESRDQSPRSFAPVGSSVSKYVHPKLSTDLGISRCLVVHWTGGRVSAMEVERYLAELNHIGFNLQGRKQVFECGDRVFLRFANIRDACTVFSNLSSNHPVLSVGRGWQVYNIAPREFSQVVEPTAGLITSHEGQLYVNAFATAQLVNSDPRYIEYAVRDLFLTQGDLFAFKVEPNGAEGNLLGAVVEYSDNDMSLKVVSMFGSMVTPSGIHVCSALFRPDIPSLASPMRNPVGTPIRSSGPPHTSVTSPEYMSDFVNDFSRMNIARPQSVVPGVHGGVLTTPARPTGYQVPPTYGMMPLVYHGVPVTPPYMFDQAPSRCPSAAPPGNYLVSPVASQSSSQMTQREFTTPRQYQTGSNGRRQNAMRVSRSPYYNVGNNHNHVDVKRIQDGIDVRTTIMLRNIPNKVDQAMLKGIVDESSWGKYDFMYLRIDFANDCNVGYAFINFVDPLDIVPFVKARGNQRWNCFKSDKVAEISYATIQGKDCLVQKFRNSSVMLEAPHYRPKLYFTLNGPVPAMAGNEEPFPTPDNQSKMKRSCENAEHVGLFTPNAGQHFRDEQRRRRSQFDRGTRLAALEEYDYDAALNRGLYSPQ